MFWPSNLAEPMALGEMSSSLQCYILAQKWTLTLGDDTTSAVYHHGLMRSVSQYSLEQRLKARLSPFKPGIPVSLSQVPLCGQWTHILQGRPYSYIFIVDHPTWTSITALDEPPVGIPQLEDIHAFIALNGDLAPHPAEYPDAITNRLFYRPFRITTSLEA
ncbi:hypothetical protein EDB86DRAFT_2836300 [Lactarius hatsudake]|nr:hypothetical protein EDB86DRAFT_2836300 [Lactarius hatsudake]